MWLTKLMRWAWGPEGDSLLSNKKEPHVDKPNESVVSHNHIG